MHAQDETILFSAIAVLLAALALGGLADFVSPDARAVTGTHELQAYRSVANGHELHASRDVTCAPAAAVPTARTRAEQRG